MIDLTARQFIVRYFTVTYCTVLVQHSSLPFDYDSIYFISFFAVKIIRIISVRLIFGPCVRFLLNKNPKNH